MTAKEVGQYLHLHPVTLRRLIRNGELPFFTIGSDWCFNRDNVDKWIAERGRSK
ncbi:MAG: helix-turn-helix domain-containing protein [Candidatus Binataceae bacterium]